jgi:hypothetical protein
MNVNLTLALNVATVVAGGVATSIVRDYPLVALGLAFLSGIGATLSSRYVVTAQAERDEPPNAAI